jgi:hypothetical protein
VLTNSFECFENAILQTWESVLIDFSKEKFARFQILIVLSFVPPPLKTIFLLCGFHATDFTAATTTTDDAASTAATTAATTTNSSTTMCVQYSRYALKFFSNRERLSEMLLKARACKCVRAIFLSSLLLLKP